MKNDRNTLALVQEASGAHTDTRDCAADASGCQWSFGLHALSRLCMGPARAADGVAVLKQSVTEEGHLICSKTADTPTICASEQQGRVRRSRTLPRLSHSVRMDAPYSEA